MKGWVSLKVDKDGSTFTFASGKCTTFKYAKGSNLLVAYASVNKANKTPSVMSAFMSLPTIKVPIYLKERRNYYCGMQYLNTLISGMCNKY